MKTFKIALVLVGGLLFACEDHSTVTDTEGAKVLTADTEPSRCDLVPEIGNCFAHFTKYYYDKTEQKCKEFVWGGCGGVVPFHTLEECQSCVGNK